jgi:hypothetical protein
MKRSRPWKTTSSQRSQRLEKWKKNDDEAKELARLLVKGGADVNYKCNTEDLRPQTPLISQF